MADAGAMLRNRAYLALLIAASTLTAGAFLAPLLVHWGLLPEGVILKACYKPLCHQMPERSFLLFGYPLAVCERCIALYCGFTLMTAIAPFIRLETRPVRHLIVVSALFLGPLCVDWLLGVSGIAANTVFTRTATGLLAGAGIAYIAVPAWIEAFSRIPSTTALHNHA